MYSWKVVIEVWPHSTGRGQTIDQKQAGDRVAEYTVRGDTIKDALAVVGAIEAGIKHNPIVWKTSVTSIVQEKTTDGFRGSGLVWYDQLKSKEIYSG
jgi:hypothetical protein